jgi:hypothetical protein
MNKFLLPTVLTLTSIAPALAQTNHIRHSEQSVAVAALRTNAVAYPRSNSCGPYLGGWQEGYPGTASC